MMNEELCLCPCQCQRKQHSISISTHRYLDLLHIAGRQDDKALLDIVDKLCQDSRDGIH